MMSVEHYIAFVMMTIIVMLTPGPAVLHSIKNGAKYGGKTAIFAIFGNVGALFILSTLSVIGLGKILVTSELFFFGAKNNRCRVSLLFGL